MIKIRLPLRYKSKVKNIIQYDDNEKDIFFAMEFYMKEVNRILEKRNIEAINAGQIRVNSNFNEWLYNLAEDEDIEMDQHSWGLILLNQGPATDKRVGEFEILFLETEEEYRNYPEEIPEVTETIYLSIQLKYAEIVHFEGSNSKIAIEILINQGEQTAITYLSQWDKGKHSKITDLEDVEDKIYEDNDYVLSYSIEQSRIALYKKLNKKVSNLKK